MFNQVFTAAQVNELLRDIIVKYEKLVDDVEKQLSQSFDRERELNRRLGEK